MIEVGGNRNSQDQVQVQVYPVRTSGFQVPHCSQPKGSTYRAGYYNGRSKTLSHLTSSSAATSD
jgi:hypothetical protein